MLHASFDARPARAGHPKEHALATPNYSYEKRQRELAKKRKNEEKLQKKKQGHSTDDSTHSDQPAPAAPTDSASTPPSAG